MSHGLMNGMFWGGVLLSSIPILLAVGIGLFVLKRYREDRALRSGDRTRD
ncbi:MAG: hypothetical protein GWM90_31350 [Gemmatimonadetes bacterium]|nr:hypothetical protein [Gemmatimonadota bacterium]NIQ59715.1 hypothetical protein [Gemmatimonadota bacterium]NIU79917.1 hypothetical protein [Gammaproteobacteria bacterium]NIX48394.1 hypothetical protein [Gemmatimonadota bacterium]NIY12835.1 hypothetical protein [Gemmatimonadota bacterium]